MPEAEGQSTESQSTAQDSGAAEKASENVPATASEPGDDDGGQPTQEDWKAIALKYKAAQEELNRARQEGRYYDQVPQQQSSSDQQPPSNGASEWDRYVSEADRQIQYNAWELKDPAAIKLMALEQQMKRATAELQISSMPESIRKMVDAAWKTGRFADPEAARWAVEGYLSAEEKKKLAVEQARIEQTQKEAQEQARRRTEGVKSTTTTPMDEAETDQNTITESKWAELMSRPPSDKEAQQAAADVQYGRKIIVKG